MPVRSIKLKMKTHSGKNALSLRQGLWKTHVIFNQGVAYYMEQLLALRQEPFMEDQTKEERQQECLERIRKQQIQNRWEGDIGEDSLVLTTLRELYELIVPSSVGNKGAAQEIGNKFLSPLVNPLSKGFTGEAKSGNTPKWKRLQAVGDPNWEKEHEKWKEGKKADPAPRVIQTLRELGCIPIFPLYTHTLSDIEWLPQPKKAVIRSWDKDMFQQAIERLLSWESWNRRVKEEKEQLRIQMESHQEKYLTGCEDWLSTIHQFEHQRNQELAEVAFESKLGYRIGPRQLRCYPQVIQGWKKIKSDSKDAYYEVIANVQRKNEREFGDPAVFRFLAHPENHFLWKEDSERLVQYAKFNAICRKWKLAKSSATLTYPDPIHHPLWMRFEAKGGSNIHTYTLHFEQKRQQSVHLDKMILPNEQGKWIETKDVMIPLATSTQWRRQFAEAKSEDKKQWIHFSDYRTLYPFFSSTGGAKIQWDRNWLQKKPPEELDLGEVGPIFFNFVVDVPPMIETKNGRLQNDLGKALKKVSETDWSKVFSFEPKALTSWIELGKKNSVSGVQTLHEGLRVMSVDLGLRTSASISVFEISKEPSSYHYPIHGTELFANHKRSFLLPLSGEKIYPKVEEQRQLRRLKFREVHSQVKALSSLLRLTRKRDEGSRRKELDIRIARLGHNSTWSESSQQAWLQVYRHLLLCTSAQVEEWEEEVISAHRKLEHLVGQAVRKWRKEWSQDRRGTVGYSLWNIQELEDSRNLLKAWSKHARFPNQMLREETGETFGFHQLKHIRNAKEDRLKKLAHSLVMTALGYKYDEEQKIWIPTYPACQLILFEDLSRYRFQLDRPRYENSQLMKWAHRSIPRAVAQRGEIFGLQVGDVASAYTSRFHAKTGAPGIRCHPIQRQEIDQLHSLRSQTDAQKHSTLWKQVIESGFLSENDIPFLKEGDLIPWEGGELFVTLQDPHGESKVISIHADLNAAQNLQRRFWSQYRELYRMSCQKGNEGEYIPKYLSKTAQSVLGKGFFVPTEHGYKWSKEGRRKRSIHNENIESEEWEEDTISTNSEKFATLFRDPSGTFFSNDTWLPQKEFWGIIRTKIGSQLAKAIRNQVINK